MGVCRCCGGIILLLSEEFVHCLKWSQLRHLLMAAILLPFWHRFQQWLHVIFAFHPSLLREGDTRHPRKLRVIHRHTWVRPIQSTGGHRDGGIDGKGSQWRVWRANWGVRYRYGNRCVVEMSCKEFFDWRIRLKSIPRLPATIDAILLTHPLVCMWC